MLKWPNDLLLGPAKLAGILLERSGGAVVVGIGVNLSWSPELDDRVTTNLQALGHAVTVDAFAPALAAAFALELRRWRGEGVAALVTRWMAAAHASGTPLVLSDGPEAGLTGAFDGLDGNGNLRLRLASGEVRSIVAGDIRLAAAP